MGPGFKSSEKFSKGKLHDDFVNVAPEARLHRNTCRFFGVSHETTALNGCRVDDVIPVGGEQMVLL